MKHLTATQIGELRRRLEVDRDRLQRQINERVPTQPGDEEPRDVQDHARSEREREQWMAEVDHARRQLEPIEVALRRMDQGDYGICQETGEPIPFARLQVNPTARYSVDVQQALEEDEGVVKSGSARPEPY